MSSSLLEVPQVNGLYLITNIFDELEHLQYVDLLTQERGHECPQIHRATEYGWKFLPLYGSTPPYGIIRQRTQDDYLGEFPEWIQNVWKTVHLKITSLCPANISQSLISTILPSHLLINKYIPGDGCTPHTDELLFWEDWVVGVNFNSGCQFNFTKDNEKVSVYMPANSVYILTGEARYKWKHGIPFVMTDDVYGCHVDRKQRISMSFRNIDKKWMINVTDHASKK